MLKLLEKIIKIVKDLFTNPYNVDFSISDEEIAEDLHINELDEKINERGIKQDYY